MSGDVQPRKRKDKKRRKDEGEQVPTQTHSPVSTNLSNDDINIHIHKEGGTGGGICAKLVFFVLLSALAVLIGMIITQYRGTTDVDTLDSESRFSHLFEGWIDSSSDHHTDHDIEEALDEHSEEHDEEESDLENISEEDEEHEPSEEEEDEEEEVTELSEEKYRDDDDDDDNDNEEQEDDDEENVSLDESEENIDQDEDVEASEEIDNESEEKGDDEGDEDDEEEEEPDEENHEEDEQELENIEREENDDDGDDGEDEDDEDNELDEGKRSVKIKSTEDSSEVEDETDISSIKKLKTKKAVLPEAENDEELPTAENAQGSSGMAVKLGVGVALLVVAHLVLVRKWRTAPDNKPPNEEPKESVTPNLSRRNTIIPPPPYQDVEPDIEESEEEYSEDDEELSEEEQHIEKTAKEKYQELRSTYDRSITPENEIDSSKSPRSYQDEYVDDEEEEEVSEEEEDVEEEEEEEGIDTENEEYDEDEDEELLKRLEAKYGKLHGDKNKDTKIQQDDEEESESDKESDDAADYEYSNITSKEDYKIKDKIDEAQKAVQHNTAYAIKLFDKLLQKYPSSPRSIYGKAQALDYLADQSRSNEILQEALTLYTQLLNTQNVPQPLFTVAAERCINRMRFIGQYRNAIFIHKKLIQKFPDNPKYLNDLAITYLTINRVEDARAVLKEILSKWPNDGVALVHFGFILKTTDGKLEEAVIYLRKGLQTKVKGVIDGRFYFHLGDALARLGRNKEAIQVYEDAVENELFLSKYQRSLYNIPRLTGKPWWNLDELPYLDLFRPLKQNWQKIRDEGLAVLNEKGFFQDESENLKDTGKWKQFELFARGQTNVKNCRKCPVTCSIISKIPEARGCKRGQSKFSVMHPGTHVWPHCGPTNCRLRIHLGLKVPSNTFIRVVDEIRSWREGEIFVFDDSFEHEVWHNGTDVRLVLIIDVWHPELTAIEKKNLSPI